MLFRYFRRDGADTRTALLLAGAFAFGSLIWPYSGMLFNHLFIAALLFGGLGACLGATLGESLKGQSLDASLRIGKAAFWGRLLGTFMKTLIGAVIAGVAIAALFV